jgi:hypothetical protein
VGITPPRLIVYDANGQALGSVTASASMGGTLSFSLSNVTPKAVYFVRVDGGAIHFFSMGAYNLAIVAGASALPSQSAGLSTLSNPHPNSTLQQAAPLTSILPDHAPQTYSETIANLATTGEVDYYRIRSAHASGNQSTVTTVNVLAQDGSGLAPVVTIYDNQGNIVPGTVLANAGGSFTIQAVTVQDRDYFVAVSAGPASTSVVGNYLVSATSAVGTVAPLQQVVVDDLTPAMQEEARTLTVTQNGLFQLALSVSERGGSGKAAQVQMLILDPSGQVVGTMTANAGQSASTAAFYLGSGVYTVLFIGVAQGPGQLSPLTFNLSGSLVSQPIGPVCIDPNSTTTGTTSTTPTSTSSLVVVPPSATFWWGPAFLPLGVLDPTSQPFTL